MEEKWRKSLQNKQIRKSIELHADICRTTGDRRFDALLAKKIYDDLSPEYTRILPGNHVLANPNREFESLSLRQQQHNLMVVQVKTP